VLSAILGVIFIAIGILAARLPGRWIAVAIGTTAIGVGLFLDGLVN
jgi:hypothetical protein